MTTPKFQGMLYDLVGSGTWNDVCRSNSEADRIRSLFPESPDESRLYVTGLLLFDGIRAAYH